MWLDGAMGHGDVYRWRFHCHHWNCAAITIDRSHHEPGDHEPSVPAERRIARAMGTPPACSYREDDKVAALLLAPNKLGHTERNRRVQ